MWIYHDWTHVCIRFRRYGFGSPQFRCSCGIERQWHGPNIQVVIEGNWITYCMPVQEFSTNATVKDVLDRSGEGSYRVKDDGDVDGSKEKKI
uniref:Uncharacterized protein n=1 Tax=Tanacetum cinerariifolium TaxID=118510 RepID=A0A6L2LBM1_TANCI|nr:hypothetical protein [Tanacetum cinerariifolium]